MHYGLALYPEVEIGRIQEIRRKYDPTFDVIGPHITVLFPVPEAVGEVELVSHIENALGNWKAFEIRLGGLVKSNDHWLFLTLVKGEREVKGLYQALYTGILARYRRDDIEFVPHLGLDTNEEIAERLGCSVPTVERRLRLIRKKWQQEESQ